METELMRQKGAAEVAKRAHELELARLGHKNLEDRPRDREDRAKAPKLPSFVDAWQGRFGRVFAEVREICRDS